MAHRMTSFQAYGHLTGEFYLSALPAWGVRFEDSKANCWRSQVVFYGPDADLAAAYFAEVVAVLPKSPKRGRLSERPLADPFYDGALDDLVPRCRDFGSYTVDALGFTSWSPADTWNAA